MWGENIKHYLALTGRTQKDLARVLNVTEATLSNYLNGKRDPHYKIMLKICEEVGVEPSELFDEPKDFKALYLLSEEKEMIQLYRALDENSKRLFQRLVQVFKEEVFFSTEEKSSLEIHEGQ